MNDYQKLALVTKSDQFYGYMIPLRDVLDKIGSAIVALNALDAIKKTLFYGRPYPIPMGEIADNASNISKNWIDITDEMDTAGITVCSDKKGEDIIHSILGIATEAGELLELLLKTVKTKNFDPVNFGEEIGDVFWYQAIGCEAVNTTFDAEQMRNIAKLKKRFGDKFSEFYANNRNLYAERKTLEDTPASLLTGTQLDQRKAVPLDDRAKMEGALRYWNAEVAYRNWIDSDYPGRTVKERINLETELKNAKTAMEAFKL